MIALAAKHPEVVPIATVHPYDGQAALDELARIAARGVKVLKIHPHTQRFAISDPRVLTLVSKAGELGMAVLIDNAGIVPGDCEDLFNLAVNAPKTRFIFAHMGGANFRFWNILALARTADGFALNNVNFDISGTVLLAADSPIEAEFTWTLRNVGIDHVMLGSDYPQISLKRMVAALEKLDLTPEEKAGIMSGTRAACWAERGRRQVIRRRSAYRATPRAALLLDSQLALAVCLGLTLRDREMLSWLIGHVRERIRRGLVHQQRMAAAA